MMLHDFKTVRFALILGAQCRQ